MANEFGTAGSQPQKSTRYAPIYTGRWSSGLWTNRSPLRDANTTRFQERYYGSNGDALIDGINVEITNRLTLARRPGNPVFDSASYSAVDRFEEFRLFNANIEQIDVMIDEANALYSLYNGVKSLVWAKSSGAGQSYMQSVGNSLYFGNGVDNKKWLQSLIVWSAGAQWGSGISSFLSTYFMDSNGNLQQLTSTQLAFSAYDVTSNVLTLTWDSTGITGNLDDILTEGDDITLSGFSTGTFLNGETVTVATVTTTQFTATFTHADTSSSDSGIGVVVQGGKPISADVEPSWSTTIPSSSNNFQGGTTLDGTAVWTNRGSPVENWGIVGPVDAPVPVIGSSRSAWHSFTFFSLYSVIIDSNGNLQQVSTDGTSGATEPVWETSVGNMTTDGSVVWTMLQTAASLIWQAGTHYDEGQFVIGNAGGTNCLFRLGANPQPTLPSTIDASIWVVGTGSQGGQFVQTYPATTPDATDTGNSLSFNTDDTLADPMTWAVKDGSGANTSQAPLPSAAGAKFNMAVFGDITIPVAGIYSLSVKHQNGFFWGFGDSSGNFPIKISGLNNNPVGQTVTAVNNYPLLGGNNVRGSGAPDGPVTDNYVINFPVAGVYPFEVDYAGYGLGPAGFNYRTLIVKANSQPLVPEPSISGATEPLWPGWSTAYAPNYPTVKESSGQYVWSNLGPTADFVWQASMGFTLPDTTIIDTNGNTEAPYRSGYTGSDAPTFATGLNQLTLDNPNLIWINQGAASAPPPGTVSAFNGGYSYAIALVNTLDNTVSNCGKLSASTGNFVGADGISFAAGSGLPDVANIDPQCDYVALFRTTDGEATPFLIPGTGNSIYTISLHDYLTSGYTDIDTDEDLNNLLQGALEGENTPPKQGAINLTYHLDRIFFSIGNTVYWTSGPFAKSGSNGVNGVQPANFNTLPSLIKRIVPLSIGAIVFTVSDIYVIQGAGTDNNPIQKAQPFLKGIGLLSYNALDLNGSLIGFFTSDNQFVILDPTAGVSYVGFPIGNLLRVDNGQPGTNWDASSVYVTWHVSGEDQAWYASDGEFGWYRLMATPAPESGYSWSPFAAIEGGVKAVQSIEVEPGVHKLLLGPTASGPILSRDLDSFVDNVTTYPANAIIGSAVLTPPGQIAAVQYITTESVRTGTPLSLALLLDEAKPYFTGPLEQLKRWVIDPPNLPESKSIFGQRFYLNLLNQPAACRHMQIQINWATENIANELLSLTVFGAYMVEG